MKKTTTIHFKMRRQVTVHWGSLYSLVKYAIAYGFLKLSLRGISN